MGFEAVLSEVVWSVLGSAGFTGRVGSSTRRFAYTTSLYPEK
jgi:hypothetical protein